MQQAALARLAFENSAQRFSGNVAGDDGVAHPSQQYEPDRSRGYLLVVPHEFEVTVAAEARRIDGYKALDAMEKHLATRTFLVAERFTIADIALYAYTHVAHEGGFDLSAYPAIRRWLERIAAEDGQSVWLGVLVGAGVAVATTHVAYHLRRRLPLSTTVSGLVEDALVIGAATLYARQR